MARAAMRGVAAPVAQVVHQAQATLQCPQFPLQLLQHLHSFLQLVQSDLASCSDFLLLDGMIEIVISTPEATNAKRVPSASMYVSTKECTSFAWPGPPSWISRGLRECCDWDRALSDWSTEHGSEGSAVRSARSERTCRC